MANKRKSYLIICVLAIFFASFFLMSYKEIIVDENTYMFQIGLFLKGDYRIDENIPMIPGYHLVWLSSPIC